MKTAPIVLIGSAKKPGPRSSNAGS